ncbi:putative isoflavone reductase [Aspergillus steynii IBT 23096]|uniref:Putative isoflavone reductase n=1 Tax=Aspergillus steynii IBT 23096 TaxID=1392250 RepID=A0A2I2GGY3_9EURO|nr:putative isoflavone reductase [Aspergillus steynii IBT 23096]PLB52140.1 putative isoflavone reductase [Aspergillus steynii IBT 23096]
MAPTKVALAGGTGNLGTAILKALLDANFSVTVLSRTSNKPIDQRAKLVEVDYSSQSALESALTGHSAVVDALGRAPQDVPIRLIDAAVNAGVTHYLPSEYGVDTQNEHVRKIPVFAGKVAVQSHLEKVTSTNPSFIYTLLATGAFLDFGLEKNFILNFAGPVADLYDGGERKFSTTTLAGIGGAVVGILRNPDATRNRAVYVSEADVSQVELLRLSGKKVETRVVRTEDLEREAYEELKKPEPSPAVFAVNFIKTALFGERFGSLFGPPRLSNEIVGVKYLSEEELREVVVKSTSA